MKTINYANVYRGAVNWQHTPRNPDATRYAQFIAAWEIHNDVTNADITLCEFADHIVSRDRRAPTWEQENNLYTIRTGDATLTTTDYQKAEAFYVLCMDVI